MAARKKKAKSAGGLTTRRAKLTELHIDPANARKHGKRNLATIRGSLRRFGQVEPLVVQRGTGRVIAGNGRLEVLLVDGETHADIVEVDVDDATATALALALNRTAELAEWDTDILAGLVPTLDADILGDIGFDIKELDLVLGRKPEVHQDEVPEPPKKAVTKFGDVWTLGRHRVVCGDASSTETVGRAASGEEAALFATDPPYGVAYGVETPHGKRIENDENDGPKLQAFLGGVFMACLPSLRPNAAWYLWHAQMTQGYFAAAAAAAAAQVLVHRQIVWVKPSLILGHGDYHWRHELCFYGWVKGNRPPWYGDRKQTTVWEVGRENDGLHPTQKPVELFSRPMQFNTKPGDVCLDPFLGSGTTLIAAEQLDRVCYGIEISPAYCDVIVERWQNLTGKKATRKKD